MFMIGSAPTLREILFISNESNGLGTAALFITSANGVVVEWLTFKHNTGVAGVFLFQTSTGVLRNLAFISNNLNIGGFGANTLEILGSSVLVANGGLHGCSHDNARQVETWLSAALNCINKVNARAHQGFWLLLAYQK